MEKEVRRDFLPYPKNLSSSLSKLNKKPLWTNLFSIKMLQSFTFYTYIVRFNPNIEIIKLKRSIYFGIEKEIIKTYGDILVFTGDNLFSVKEVKDKQDFFIKKNGVDYTVTITKTEETINVNKYNPLQNQAVKRISEEILKTILRANPQLEFSKDFFVKINEKTTIFDKIDFFPGYKNSIHYLSQGIFTSISLKNRMLSIKNCFLLIKEKESEYTQSRLTKDQIQKSLNDHFSERTVKMLYKGKRTYYVSKVNFNKSPKNTSFLFDGKLIINLGSNVSLINYYKAAYGVDIKNPDQPLFESEVTNHDGKTSVIYLVPELCLLSGIDDSCIADRDFMTELAKQTKFVPKGINLVLNKIVLLKLKNVSNFSKKNQRKLEQ